MPSKFIRIPCCLYFDRETAIRLNLQEKMSRSIPVPDFVKNSSALMSAINAGADQLEPFNDMHPVAAAVRLKGEDVKIARFATVEIAYLDSNLNPLFTVTETADAAKEPGGRTYYYLPVEKDLSYTAKTYASLTSVAREMTARIGDLFPKDFNVASHICTITGVELSKGNVL